MTVDPIQRDLNARFTYRSDASTGAHWTILKDDGEVEGDCDNYALTLPWLYEDRSARRFWWAMVRFKYVVWLVQLSHGGWHVVVWCRGRGWTDNIQREFMTWSELKEQGYRRRFPMVAPVLGFVFLLRPLLPRLAMLARRLRHPFTR